MKISLNITTQCNYDCWYCQSHSSNYQHMSIEILNRVLKKLPPGEIQVLGGEPTLHPEFETVVKLLGERDFYIQTNLSFGAFKKLEKLNCKLCVSVHNITDDLIGRIRRLQDCICCLDVMANPTILKDFKSLYILCKTENLTARLRPLMPLGKFDEYDIAEFYRLLEICKVIAPPEWLDKSLESKRIEYTNKNSHYLKDCISQGHLSVFVDGTISRCPYGKYEGICKYEFCPLI